MSVTFDSNCGRGGTSSGVCIYIVRQVLSQVVELTADSGSMTPLQPTAAMAEPDLEGVPALPACRVKLVWEADGSIAGEVRVASISRDYLSDGHKLSSAAARSGHNSQLTQQ